MLYGTRTPRQVTLRPGQRFGGFAVRAPRGGEGFGSAVARLGRGFVACAPGSPFGRLQGRGAAWLVRGRNARPLRVAGPRTGGPIGLRVDVPGDVRGDRRQDVLVVGRGHRSRAVRVLLLSSSGRRLATYSGLRNSREARSAAAGAGDVGGSRRPDLIFGSPGTSTAYVLLSGE